MSILNSLLGVVDLALIRSFAFKAKSWKRSSVDNKKDTQRQEEREDKRRPARLLMAVQYSFSKSPMSLHGGFAA